VAGVIDAVGALVDDVAVGDEEPPSSTGCR
jgi:hypothetical protein